jgi:hypothetical protein
MECVGHFHGETAEQYRPEANQLGPHVRQTMATGRTQRSIITAAGTTRNPWISVSTMHHSPAGVLIRSPRARTRCKLVLYVSSSMAGLQLPSLQHVSRCCEQSPERPRWEAWFYGTRPDYIRKKGSHNIVLWRLCIICSTLYSTRSRYPRRGFAMKKGGLISSLHLMFVCYLAALLSHLMLLPHLNGTFKFNYLGESNGGPRTNR